MSSRLLGWAAAVLVILITLALIIGEITNAAQRSWWGAHSLTTDTVSGMLVLLITVLVVNQLLNMRQDRQRGQAVAAEAAIIEAQAGHAAKAVSSVIDGSGDRGAASDSYRTYMVMLLIGAPVLIDDQVARNFLERAQNLGGVMTHTLAIIDRSPHGAAVPSDGLDDALQQIQSAAAPLLRLLSPRVRDSMQRIGSTAKE